MSKNDVFWLGFLIVFVVVCSIFSVERGSSNSEKNKTTTITTEEVTTESTTTEKVTETTVPTTEAIETNEVELHAVALDSNDNMTCDDDNTYRWNNLTFSIENSTLFINLDDVKYETIISNVNCIKFKKTNIDTGNVYVGNEGNNEYYIFNVVRFYTYDLNLIKKDFGEIIKEN